MFWATALLLIHPQFSTIIPMTADKAAVDATSPAIVAASVVVEEEFLPLAPVSAQPAALPVAEESEELPDEPLPLAPVAMVTPAPMPFVSAARPLTVSVAQLRAENRRKELMWRGLIVASSGAAEFDAWSTRRAITHYGAQELNPLLKPFAGNASLYAAIQTGPVVMDFLGRKMMNSHRAWVRRAWWVPQSASFVTSLFCGAHNVAFH